MGWSKEQAHCSPSCAAKNRPPGWWATHHAKTAATRRERGYSRMVQRLTKAGLTPEQIAQVRIEIQRVRVSSHAAGKRRGWADALGEKEVYYRALRSHGL